MKEDTEAFNEVMEGFKLPKNTEEEKKARKEAIQKALKKATDVPLRTMEAAFDTTGDLKALLEHGNKNAISDVGVAALQARAAYDGAKMNVLINLGSIKDEEFVKSVRSKLDGMDSTFYKDIEEVVEGVKKELG